MVQVVKMSFFFGWGLFLAGERRTVRGSGEPKPSGGRHSTPSRDHNSWNGRAGLGLSMTPGTSPYTLRERQQRKNKMRGFNGEPSETPLQVRQLLP